ncbi:MAG: tyrosine-type recombinase/integrase [Anaerocolumna sp.]
MGRLLRNELNLNFKYHNLRHTHCSRLAEMNISMIVVKQRLGHSKEETMMRYFTHLTDRMRDNLPYALNNS